MRSLSDRADHHRAGAVKDLLQERKEETGVTIRNVFSVFSAQKGS